MAGLIGFLVLNRKILSSHMYHISQTINTTNQKIHSHDQMIKMIVNLGSKKDDKNDDSSPKIINLHNTLLMCIVDATENDLLHGEGKSVIRKVCSSSVKSYSTLFSCSVRAMYNKGHRTQNQRLMLKPYITEINLWVGYKRCYNNYFNENIVNKVHDWIEKHPLFLYNQPPCPTAYS